MVKGKALFTTFWLVPPQITVSTIRDDQNHQDKKMKTPGNVHQQNILIKQCNHFNFREKIPRA